MFLVSLEQKGEKKQGVAGSIESLFGTTPFRAGGQERAVMGGIYPGGNLCPVTRSHRERGVLKYRHNQQWRSRKLLGRSDSTVCGGPG